MIALRPPTTKMNNKGENPLVGTPLRKLMSAMSFLSFFSCNADLVTEFLSPPATPNSVFLY